MVSGDTFGTMFKTSIPHVRVFFLGMDGVVVFNSVHTYYNTSASCQEDFDADFLEVHDNLE
jgi:hypothetical protein